VCDSNKVATRGVGRYFVTLVDAYFKYCYTYLLKSEEVLDKFKTYKTEVENQLKRSNNC